MIRTVLAAGLLAALAMPAFAEDAIVKTEKSANMSKIDQTTTSSTTDAKQSNMAPTAVDGNMYGGCMHHKNTALNMM